MQPNVYISAATLPNRGAKRSDRLRPPTMAMYAYALVLVVEIVAQTLFHSHAVIGAAVAGALTLACICALIDSFPLREAAREPVATFSLCFLGGATAVGIYMTLVGYFLGNNRYFLAADVFHWFGELVAMAVLGVWVFRRREPLEIQRIVLRVALLLGLIGLVVVMLGVGGVRLAGGHSVSTTGLWRLEIGRAFPGLPLLLVLAIIAWRPQKRCHIPWGRALIGIGMLLIVLVFTFKRTQWLSLLMVSPLLFLPKRYIAPAAYFAGLSSAIILLLATGLPKQTQQVAMWLSESLTYNKRFTIDESLERRVRQLAGLREDVANARLGSGFGAEFMTYVPKTQKFESVHYVHNLYWYYLLQMGLCVALACAALFLFYLCTLWRQIEISPDIDGLLRGSLCGLVMLALSGVTLLSTHTTFTGFLIALGLVFRGNTQLPRNEPSYITLRNYSRLAAGPAGLSCRADKRSSRLASRDQRRSSELLNHN